MSQLARDLNPFYPVDNNVKTQQGGWLIHVN